LDQSLQRATRLVLATSERIYCIFNVYDLYRRFSAIRRIVGSLTPTIDANFRNDCLDLPKSALGSFRPLQGSSRWGGLRLDTNRLNTSHSQRLNSGKSLGTSRCGGVQLIRVETSPSPRGAFFRMILPRWRTGTFV